MDDASCLREGVMYWVLCRHAERGRVKVVMVRGRGRLRIYGIAECSLGGCRLDEAIVGCCSSAATHLRHAGCAEPIRSVGGVHRRE
jgi:hypothetical protein